MDKRQFRHFFGDFFSIGLLLAGTSSFAADLSRNDLQLANKLSQANLEEIAMGRLAKEKASNPAVRDFGKRMIDDHTLLQNQLQQWASAHHVTLKTTPDHDAQSMQKDLSHLSGTDLDHRYIQDMLKDHQKDAAELHSFLNSNPRSPLKPLIQKTLPIIENHLRVAENVAGQLRISPRADLQQPEHPPKG